MKKFAIIMIVLISILMLTGCAIRTPQINGLVLDEETKQPVPEAWVWARIELNTATIAGDVHSAITIDQPHTRTDKNGKFVIPSRKIKGSSFPFEFGTEVISLAIGASTVDDLGSRINYYGGYKEKDFGKGDGDLNKLLWKNTVEITMYAKHFQSTESESFNHLQSLYNYCITGRSGIETPAVEGGCDAWELDYAIKKHERYLEKFGSNSEHAGGTFLQLGYLYKRKGNYIKAIESFKMNLDFDKTRNIRFRRYESENQIIELKKLIN